MHPANRSSSRPCRLATQSPANSHQVYLPELHRLKTTNCFFRLPRRSAEQSTCVKLRSCSWEGGRGPCGVELAGRSDWGSSEGGSTARFLMSQVWASSCRRNSELLTALFPATSHPPVSLSLPEILYIP